MFQVIEQFAAHDIAHGFFGRKGGVSTGVFDSLNCSLSSNDDRDTVFENRARVAAAMDVPRTHLLATQQTHSPDCLFIDAPYTLDTRPKCDAQVTTIPGLALGVLSGDCGPVLFYGRTRNGGPIIGVAHAGWGGALKGVLESTVMIMCDHGAELSTIAAAVGPCITKKSYEVSLGFEEPFLTRNPDDEVFFHGSNKPDKLMFDLPGYIARRLSSCGVKNVILSDIDTVANAKDYFSYRRSCLQKQPQYGLQMSVIVIPK